MDDEIDALYRIFFNLAIQSVTQKALEGNYTIEEVADELEKEIHLLVDNISVDEGERFVHIMEDEVTNFIGQIKSENKDVKQIMEEIGWT